MNPTPRLALALLTLLVGLLIAPPLWAKEEPTLLDEPPILTQEELEQATSEKLADILKDLNRRKMDLAEKSKELKSATIDADKSRLKGEIDKLNQSIKEQEHAFEMIVTGGVALAKVEGAEEKKFDWQKDLLEILQPIMSEMRELTKDKRRLENLKNRILFHTNQIKTINESIAHIDTIDPENLGEAARERYFLIQKKWHENLQENQHLMEVAQLQMDGLIKAQEAQVRSASESLKLFIHGRGTTLGLALLASLSIFLLMRGLSRLLGRLFSGRKRSYLQRLFSLIYQIATGLFAIAAIFAVFHHRSDRALQAITILLLVGVLWVLKNSIPKYISELRLLLNVGLVREGERILYQGLPWRVENVHFFATLVNPAVTGGEVRVPLAVLTDMHSRKPHPDEPWFPCGLGDVVELSDGTFGRVEVVSLEGVVLLGKGDTRISYSLADFLATTPKNLSSGFRVSTIFGIGYDHQQRACEELPALFEKEIGLRLQKSPYGPHLKQLLCQLNEAAASSINFRINADFDGEFAWRRGRIYRAIQRYCVEICNEHQLEIPFNQLTVHYESSQGD
ncbi:MAG: hypothetical protein HQL52_10765 [Magnetococcales bacterium]|nr:hypothetical protein [Magnetococcales bacterium]